MKTIVKIFPSVVLGFFVGVFLSLTIFYFYAIGSVTSPPQQQKAYGAQISSFANTDVVPPSLLTELRRNFNFLIRLRRTSLYTEPLAESPLNGLKNSETKARLPIIAVMVENLQPARPQSGLSAADIVYETLVESGITRFMALFQSKEADVVGPVRSARTYFAEIVREYDAWYSHVGGNADALQFIAKYKLNNLDQFFLNKPYWRDAERRKRGLEHSMYTDTEELRKLTKGDFPKTFIPWQFKKESALNIDRESLLGSNQREQPPQKNPSKQTIQIDFSKPAFKVKWEYNPAENSYQRYLAGTPHKDAQNDEILSAKNIVVQYVKMSLVANTPHGDEGALDLQLIGQGKGIFFRDGKSFPITWKKEKSTERTQYFDENNDEIIFNPGVIWIELAKNQDQIKIESEDNSAN